MIEHGQFVENCVENEWTFEIAAEQAAQKGYRVWNCGQRTNGRWWVSLYRMPKAPKHPNDKTGSDMTVVYEAESAALAICHTLDRMMFHIKQRGPAGMDPHGTGNNKWPEPMSRDEWDALQMELEEKVSLEALYAFHDALVRLKKVSRG